ncbi:MAG: hypothetical protein JW888_15040, partial [Pirellulales bacterium]|nr:hypothetical protein [Pirellulales bacterium]
WTRVGHLGDPTTVWGEIRTFDTDGDGYFDRWETYRSGQPRPARTSTVRDGGIRDLPNDWVALQRIYTQEILPEALAANEKLMAAMRRVDGAFRVPDDLTKALAAAACDSEKCYVEDIIRETQYLALRDKLLADNEKRFANVPADRDRRKAARTAETVGAWTDARTLSELDAAYAEGRYDDAIRILKAWMPGP